MKNMMTVVFTLLMTAGMAWAKEPPMMKMVT